MNEDKVNELRKVIHKYIQDDQIVNWIVLDILGVLGVKELRNQGAYDQLEE